MANKMIVKRFSDKLTANQGLFEEIKNVIDTVAESGKTPTILLSGGSSPKKLYQLLGKAFESKGSLKIGLVDERFVPTDKEDSNERMIRSCFSDKLEILGMVLNDTSYEENLVLLTESYSDFMQDLDIVLLGMGEDGHFASIFPFDTSSERAIAMKEKSVLNTCAPNYPERRITCNLEMLVGAKHIYLLMFGLRKLSLLENSEQELPIKSMLDKRPDIQIFYAND
jgi:6-phosphogluconolactonase